MNARQTHRSRRFKSIKQIVVVRCEWGRSWECKDTVLVRCGQHFIFLQYFHQKMLSHPLNRRQTSKWYDELFRRKRPAQPHSLEVPKKDIPRDGGGCRAWRYVATKCLIISHVVSVWVCVCGAILHHVSQNSDRWQRVFGLSYSDNMLWRLGVAVRGWYSYR